MMFMARERWGAFSVIDHKNTAAYVPEVLLYDKLVIPVPPKDNRVGKVEPIRLEARSSQRQT